MRAVTRPLAMLGLAATLALGACGSESTSPAAVQDTPILPADHVLYNLHHTMTRNGVRSSILDADTAYQREDSHALDLIGVRLTFFTESGTESGTLTSKTGTYSMDVGEFAARDSVVLITQTPNGTRRIESQSLNYNLKRDQLWSDSPFIMYEGGKTTRGTRFRSDGQLGDWSVTDAETTGGLPADASDLSF